MNDEKEMRLVVEVKARVDWRTPAATIQEQVMRDVASSEAQKAAHEIEDAVKLIVAVMLTRR